MSEITPGGLLSEDPEFTPLVRDWLAGKPGLDGAATQWRRFLADEATERPAPLWSARDWRDGWLAEQLSDQPDDEARDRVAAAVAELAAGRADVVVTGQQPGFLGGPLYTLWKVATAVAAAEARTRAGRPTFALFWSGDDDDDRVEAFAPWLWDPARGAFLRAPTPAGAADLMVGAAPAAQFGRGELGWLRERAPAGGFASRLADLWAVALAGGLSWGRLQRRALLALLRPATVLCVSGADGGLHAAAAPFYDVLWRRLGELSAAAAASGSALTAAGWHAQLGPGSLERPLHVEDAGRRLALSPEQLAAPRAAAAATLRPGVLLRSPVQDWLLRPAGVIVGPGELAYLVQLLPAYRALALPRPPLLARLFATLAPLGEPSSAAQAAGEGDSPSGDWDALAGPLAAQASAALALTLRERLGLDADAADRAARSEGERWRQSVARRLAREAERSRARTQAGPAPWTRPFGRPQERTLAVQWAGALWGGELGQAALAAARAHVAAAGEPRRLRISLAAP